MLTENAKRDGVEVKLEIYEDMVDAFADDFSLILTESNPGPRVPGLW